METFFVFFFLWSMIEDIKLGDRIIYNINVAAALISLVWFIFIDFFFMLSVHCTFS